jgi:hypothetical protein
MFQSIVMVNTFRKFTLRHANLHHADHISSHFGLFQLIQFAALRKTQDSALAGGGVLYQRPPCTPAILNER